MGRKFIQPGRMIAILNERLQRHVETMGCRVVAIEPAEWGSDDDCNWSSNVTWDANGNDVDAATRTISRHVTFAQTEFNLIFPRHF